MSFQIRNLRREVGGFDAIATRHKVVFNEMHLSLDEGEFVSEAAEPVVGVPEMLDLGDGVPIIEGGHSAVESVVGRGRAIEQGVEPHR